MLQHEVAWIRTCWNIDFSVLNTAMKTKVISQSGLDKQKNQLTFLFQSFWFGWLFEEKMVQRITYRRRLSYNTKSNRRKKVRTPGGKLVFQYLKKRPALPKCPMTGVKLKGVKPSRPAERKRLSLRHKKVFRAYGGRNQISTYQFLV